MRKQSHSIQCKRWSDDAFDICPAELCSQSRFTHQYADSAVLNCNGRLVTTTVYIRTRGHPGWAYGQAHTFVIIIIRSSLSSNEKMLHLFSASCIWDSKSPFERYRHSNLRFKTIKIIGVNSLNFCEQEEKTLWSKFKPNMFARWKISSGRTREREDRQRERGRVGKTPKTDTSSAIYKGKPEIVTLDKTV